MTRKSNDPDTDAQPRKRAPGGGRKPLGGPTDPTREQMVTMPQSYWDTATAAGSGNASAGLRATIEAWRRRRKK